MKKICRLLSAMLIVAMVLSGCGKVNTLDTEVDTQKTERQSETENVTTSEMETERTETVSETTIEVETETQTESEIPSEPEAQTYTYADMDKTMYVKSAVNVRSLPSTDGEKLGGFSKAQEVHVIGQCNETGWYRIEYNGGTGYVSNNYLQDSKPVGEVVTQPTQPGEPEECPVDLYVIHDEGDYVYMWGYFHSYEECSSQAHINKCEEMRNYVIGKWGYNYRGDQECDNHVSWNGHTLCRWVWRAN